MKFKTDSNKIYHFESVEEMEKYYKGSEPLTRITDEEATAILNPPLTPEQQLAKMINDATAMIDGMIQKVIDDYNSAHGVNFKNVDALPKYAMKPNYTHNQFCMDVLDWVTSDIGIWETARAIQGEVMAGTREIPTEQEFIAMLPQYEGVV